MMTTHEQVVREARSWIGTRWRHQAATKGVGCDCIGLVRGVGIEVGLVPKDWQSELPEVGQFLGYGRHPFRGTLERACDLYMDRIPATQARPGDLILLQYNQEPHHIGILGDYHCGGLSIIHAYAPRRSVIETRLDEVTRSKIVAWYRYKGI